MIRRPPRSTLSSSSAASDVYKRQPFFLPEELVQRFHEHYSADNHHDAPYYQGEHRGIDALVEDAQIESLEDGFLGSPGDPLEEGHLNGREDPHRHQQTSPHDGLHGGEHSSPDVLGQVPVSYTHL